MYFSPGEEDAIELEGGDTSPQKPSPVKKEISPKPAELLKDIQSTVHQAKSKIGDLQVPITNLDVPYKHSSVCLLCTIFRFLLALLMTCLLQYSCNRGLALKKHKKKQLFKSMFCDSIYRRVLSWRFLARMRRQMCKLRISCDAFQNSLMLSVLVRTYSKSMLDIFLNVKPRFRKFKQCSNHVTIVIC